MGAPKTRRGRETREQILKAAEIVFGRKGFNSTSIAEITQEANIAQGTFYIYFKSKEEAFRELVLEMGRMARHSLSRVSSLSPDRLSAERAGLLAFLEFVARHPGLYRIVEEAQFVDPESYKAYFTVFAESYKKQLIEADAAGDIRPGDAEIRAWALMGMAKSLGQRFALWNGGKPLDEVADIAFDMIENGLKP